MRIISGKFKGRRLQGGKDLKIRPTTDRVKEYIFSILQDFQVDKNVVDIFSGSGNLGLEALSRGASHITFVEKNLSSIQVLKKNLLSFNLNSNSFTIINKSAEEYIKSNRLQKELYFLDPPFNILNLQTIIDTLTTSEIFLTGHLIVLEHEVSNPIETESEKYKILKQKKIGRSLISFIEKGNSDA
jgi:16S rRNA (guanine966-N2)-methyltransferase